MEFTGERFIPNAKNVEPALQRKMYQEHLARYLFARLFVRDKDVLDIGCGTGYGAQILLTGFPKSITGIDISADAIRFAQEHYRDPRLKFFIADAQNLPFKNNQFDIIIAFEVIEHVEDYVRLITEVRRTLKPTGIFIVSTPRKKNSLRSSFHIREFDFHEFQLILKAHFPNVRFYGQNNYLLSAITDENNFKEFTEAEFIADIPINFSDCFIAVCGEQAQVHQLDHIVVGVFNNIEYIENLEKDVRILRSAEERLVFELQEKEKALAEGQRQIEQLNAALQEKEKALAEGQRQIEQLNAALRPLPLRAWRIYFQFGWKELVKRIILYVLVHLNLADYSPPGSLSAVDKAIAILQQRGLAQLWQSIKLYYRRRRLVQQLLSRVEVAPPSTKPRMCRAPQPFKPLFFVGTIEGESKRYRVFNVAEHLAQAGIRSSICYEINFDINRLADYDVLYFMRAGISPKIEEAISKAKALNIPTIFEIDDYVFEPNIIPYIDAIRGWSPADVRAYEDGVRRYRETLKLCDYVVTSTEYLAARARELGKKAFVLRNMLSAHQIEIAKRARLRRHLKSFLKKFIGSARVTIGYFSGTYTHNADFRQAAPALLRILEEFPNVDLLIVGPLDLDPSFERYKKRIRRHGLVPWSRLPHLIAKVDINIAPLEVGNPYCEAKSELKYIEAGILGIPTVASPTDSYRHAIKSGENGFLAGTDEDWYLMLRALITDAALRRRIGDAAYQDVLTNYGPKAGSRQAMRIFSEILTDWRSRRGTRLGSQGLKISWVVPPPFRGSGGHRNIFRVARYLQKFGHQVAIYVHQDCNFKTSEQLKAFVNKEFGDLNAEIILGTEKIKPCDALFATHWSTVSTVLANKAKAKKLFYFVQDYEPYFVPMSYEYICAENTYKQGLAIITSGPWCAHVLKEKHGVDAAFFRFPIDRNIYFPRPDCPRRQNLVIFFARPEMPRRLFPLGVEALQLLKERRPGIEIILFGSDSVPMPLPFDCRNLGVVSDLNVLARLYSSATVGVAFSITNPSLVPFEMMACGCPVIDVDYGNNYINYGSRENAMLVPPTPEGVVEGIERLLDDEDLRTRIARNGYTFVQTFPTEEQVARTVENFILQQLMLK
ncbi:MAG: methyltransferase domain-containing protein [Thermosphaera sp.]